MDAMKKIVLAVFIFTLSQICFAQQSKDSVKYNEGRWSIMAWGGPNYSYRYDAAKSIGPDKGVSLLNKQEEPYSGFEFGMDMIYKFNSHFSLLFGFAYNQYVYRSIVLDTVEWDYCFGYIYPTPSGYINNSFYQYSQPYQINSRYYFKECFYNFPLAMQYSLLAGHRISFVVDVGVAIGFLTEKFYIQPSNDTIYRVNPPGIPDLPEERLESGYFSVVPFVKLGTSFKISDKINFLIQPGFAYDLSGMYGITKHIYSFDATGSIVMKL